MPYKKIKYNRLLSCGTISEGEGLQINIKFEGHIIKTAAEYKQHYIVDTVLLCEAWHFTLIHSGEFLFTLDKLKDINKEFEHIISRSQHKTKDEYLEVLLNRPDINELSEQIKARQKCES